MNTIPLWGVFVWCMLRIMCLLFVHIVGSAQECTGLVYHKELLSMMSIQELFMQKVVAGNVTVLWMVMRPDRSIPVPDVLRECSAFLG